MDRVKRESVAKVRKVRDGKENITERRGEDGEYGCDKEREEMVMEEQRTGGFVSV